MGSYDPFFGVKMPATPVTHHMGQYITTVDDIYIWSVISPKENGGKVYSNYNQKELF